MKTLIISLTVFCVVLSFSVNVFAGDKEDVQAAIENNIKAFNSHNFKAYFDAFAEDNTEFTTVGSPLRFDANAWKDFIEGTASLEFVNYSQQDNVIAIYNGDTAVISGYYIFKTMPKGGELSTQTGRASIIMVKKNGKWLTVHMHFSKMF